MRPGLLTREPLRSSPWRRLRQDVYVDARVPVTHVPMISAAGPVDDVASAADPVDVWTTSSTSVSWTWTPSASFVDRRRPDRLTADRRTVIT